jgi:hypothetical protein
MPSPPSRVSNRLRRAAAAEHATLAQRRERIERAREGARAELERLERELADIDDHLELLVRIAPDAAGDAQPAPQSRTPRHQQPGPPQVLQGPAIRAAAVRLLVEHAPSVQAIHYRDWYRLLQAHGFAVAGKKPLAVFLSQVSRSPVIRKATAAGVYALDRDAADRLRCELSELEAELHTLTGQRSSGRVDGDAHTRRRTLVLAIARRERALQEAVHGLSPADPDPPHRGDPQRSRER